MKPGQVPAAGTMRIIRGTRPGTRGIGTPGLNMGAVAGTPAVTGPVIAARINAVPMPVATAPQPDADGKTDAERDEGNFRGLVLIHEIGIIIRHVEHFGIGGIDFDRAVVRHHLLLGRRLKIAQALGFGPLCLDGRHDIRLLGEDSRPSWLVHSRFSFSIWRTSG